MVLGGMKIIGAVISATTIVTVTLAADSRAADIRHRTSWRWAVKMRVSSGSDISCDAPHEIADGAIQAITALARLNQSSRVASRNWRRSQLRTLWDIGDRLVNDGGNGVVLL